jgi:hypothetical protein
VAFPDFTCTGVVVKAAKAFVPVRHFRCPTGFAHGPLHDEVVPDIFTIQLAFAVTVALTVSTPVNPLCSCANVGVNETEFRFNVRTLSGETPMLRAELSLSPSPPVAIAVCGPRSVRTKAARSKSPKDPKYLLLIIVPLSRR